MSANINSIETFEFTFKNPAKQKLFANFLSDAALRSIMQYVYAEFFPHAGIVNFVACDGTGIGVITNREKGNIYDGTEEEPLRTYFSKDAWKSICNAAKIAKSSVTFEVYIPEGAKYAIAVARINDISVGSAGIEEKYPHWRSVFHDAEKYKRFEFTKDAAKDLCKYLTALKKDKVYDVAVSFYRGSDVAYLDFSNSESSVVSLTTLQLTEKAEATCGQWYNVGKLLRAKPTAISIHREYDLQTYPAYIDSVVADSILQMPLSRDGAVSHINEREVV